MSNWLSRLALTTDLAIDLGTANTVVAVRGQGIVLDEPSVVAIRKGSRPTKVQAVGREAKDMLGKTPAAIKAIRPMREGVISDVDVTEEMIRRFIEKAVGRRPLRARMLISVPAGITQVERKAVRDAALKAGVKEVHLIEQPMAAAIGAGLPVSEPRGSMIVDIGGGTTDVAVISLGAMATEYTLRTAGDAMDLAIQQYIRERKGILVGLPTAEKIKMKIGRRIRSRKSSRWTCAETARCRACHAQRSSPRWMSVRRSQAASPRSTKRCAKCSKRPTRSLASDLMEHGILLAGGGSQLLGLDAHLTEVTQGLKVRCAGTPLHAVVHEVLVALEQLDTYRDLLQ